MAVSSNPTTFIVDKAATSQQDVGGLDKKQLEKMISAAL